MRRRLPRAMRWLHRTRRLVQHSPLQSSHPARFSIFVAPEELRRGLSILHVARLTTFLQSPAANWCDTQLLPPNSAAAYRRQKHTRATTDYTLQHISYGPDRLTSSAIRRVHPPRLSLNFLPFRIPPKQPLHHHSRPHNAYTPRHSTTPTDLPRLHPPFETADPDRRYPYRLSRPQRRSSARHRCRHRPRLRRRLPPPPLAHLHLRQPRRRIQYLRRLGASDHCGRRDHPPAFAVKVALPLPLTSLTHRDGRSAECSQKSEPKDQGDDCSGGAEDESTGTAAGR
jgi:hypothetical protein